jgi:hypothetical protein
MMRAQSHVVGVALMAGLAVIALGTLTVGVGTVVDSQASNADANRVADGMTEALQGVDQTGVHSQQVTFSEGHLGTTERTLRVIQDGTVIAEIQVDALVYETGDRRVAALAGAVIRGQGEHAWTVAEPPITSSERTEVLVIGAPVLDAGDVSVSGKSGVTATLRTNVTHTERELGRGEFAVAIETKTPEPFERHFEDQGATTTRRTFAGDEFASVVATYPGTRDGYLVRHNLGLEVGS